MDSVIDGDQLKHFGGTALLLHVPFTTLDFKKQNHTIKEGQVKDYHPRTGGGGHTGEAWLAG